MALAKTGYAIGSVTRLLQAQLFEKLKNKGVNGITSNRPGKIADTTLTNLNLFLYEIQYDAQLKNKPLDEGQKPPLWLVLKYLLTVHFKGESDSDEAHDYLGLGMQALQELSFLPLISSTTAALGDNPGVLKITFDEIPPDLLSKLMQGGADEKYRLSVGFQVRPIMIATSDLPSYSLLVGIDYKNKKIIGEKGISTSVIPSLGPVITQLSPSHFEIDDILTIVGHNLDLSGLSVMIGSIELALIAQRPDMVQCRINGNIAKGKVISAGSYPVSVVQTMPYGRHRSSNLLIGSLLPTLVKVTPDSFVPTLPPELLFGTIYLDGYLLANNNDDILVALYKDGAIVKLLDEKFPSIEVLPPPPSPIPPPKYPLTRITLIMEERDAVLAGNYRIILRVNGQQAKNSPEVTIL
jgi:hypothetical protein